MRWRVSLGNRGRVFGCVVVVVGLAVACVVNMAGYCVFLWFVFGCIFSMCHTLVRKGKHHTYALFVSHVNTRTTLSRAAQTGAKGAAARNRLHLLVGSIHDVVGSVTITIRSRFGPLLVVLRAA